MLWRYIHFFGCICACLHACTRVHLQRISRECAHTCWWKLIGSVQLLSKGERVRQLVRVIGIIMALLQPDSLLLSTQACVWECLCLFVTSWAHEEEEKETRRAPCWLALNRTTTLEPLIQTHSCLFACLWVDQNSWEKFHDTCNKRIKKYFPG